jgi:hypothetical protein
LISGTRGKTHGVVVNESVLLNRWVAVWVHRYCKLCAHFHALATVLRRKCVTDLRLGLPGRLNHHVNVKVFVT